MLGPGNKRILRRESESKKREREKMKNCTWSTSFSLPLLKTPLTCWLCVCVSVLSLLSAGRAGPLPPQGIPLYIFSPNRLFHSSFEVHYCSQHFCPPRATLKDTTRHFRWPLFVIVWSSNWRRVQVVSVIVCLATRSTPSTKVENTNWAHP